MSYHFYKILHLVSILFFIGGVGASCFGTQTNLKKSIKIVMGVSSLLILVAGMGLLARLGFSHGAGFPTWVVFKLLIWLLLAVGAPIVFKRVSHGLGKWFYLFLTLASLAAWFAIYKPGA